MIRVSLDGTYYDDPTNWKDFEENIVRDDTLRGLLLKYNLPLSFTGKAYDYIYTKKNSAGYCTSINIIVEESCAAGFVPLLDGRIMISDCKFNLNKCTVECPIIDNSYYALIHNNKKLKAKLNVPLSKNGVTITPCYSESITFVNPRTNVIMYNRLLYRVNDAFRYLIDYMSDGTIGFTSTYLNNLNASLQERLFITTGWEIRNYDGDNMKSPPTISFDELFTECNKKMNLGFTVEVIAGVPTIRIEDYDYFFKTNTAFSIPNCQDVIESIDTFLLYSNINIGGPAATYNPTYHSLPPVALNGFQEESYTIQGECNIDNSLDLQGSFICDSNIIEELILTNTTNKSYDSKVFFIQVNITNVVTMTPLLNATLPPGVYNDWFLNSNVAARFNIQGDLAIYLGNGDDGCLVLNPSLQAPATLNGIASTNLSPIPLSNIVSDPNGNFSNVTYRYTAPSQGYYTFKVVQYYEITSGTNIAINNAIQYYHYDSFGNIRNSPLINHVNDTTPGLYVYQTIQSFAMNSGDYIQMEAKIVSNDPAAVNVVVRIRETEFECIDTFNGGGVFQQSVSGAYKTSIFKFEYPISFDDWNILKADLSQNILFGTSSPIKKGWIKSIKRNNNTSMAQIELISDVNNSQ